MINHLKTILTLIIFIVLASLIVLYPIILLICLIFISYIWIYGFFNGGINL
jgi:hypothetical protein